MQLMLWSTKIVQKKYTPINIASINLQRNFSTLHG
jgi:hypothetical protein